MSAKTKERGLSSPRLQPNDALKSPSSGVETEIGSFPSTWRVDRFDSLFAVQQGKQVSKANRIGENQRPFLRTKNVSWGGLDLSDLDEMHFTEAEEKRLALHSGDLLVCEGGDIGRTTIWNGALPRCYYQNHLHRARLRDKDAADSLFALYWLWYAFEIGSVYFGRGNVTTIPNLSQSKLCELPLPVPPVSEQRKIAGVLGVVQRAMEQQERLLALTAELKKALLHQLFTAGLRGEPQKQTDLGPVPESWEVLPIGSLGRVVTGSTPKTQVPEYYAPQEVDFIAPADLGNTKCIYDSQKKISREGLATIRQLPGRAVMCVCIGSSIGKVGMTSKPHSATNQQINSIICNDRHDPAFIYYLMSYLATYWRGFATFGPVPILSKGAFEVIKIATPAAREEEHEIATILNAFDVKMEVHQRKHATLTALFRTLLHQLMTAQIRVRDGDHAELRLDDSSPLAENETVDHARA